MCKSIQFRGLPALIGLIAVVAGCGGPKSSSTSGPAGGPVPTSKMTLKLSVEAKDTTTAVVRANVNDGQFATATSYRLDGGDFFRACLNGVCRSMADNDSVFNPEYITRFDFQPGIEFLVSFNRQQDRNAPDSRVVLPMPFTIVTPANRQQVTDGEVVIVSWSPTGAPATPRLDYNANCSKSDGTTSFSTGTLTNNAGNDGTEAVSIDRITSIAQPGTPGVTLTRCSIVIKVSHELVGRVDPAFHGGTAVGNVSREVTLDYVPR